MNTPCQLLCAALLSACVSAPKRAEHATFYADPLFKAPTETLTAQAVFGLSEPMRRSIDASVARLARSKGVEQALLESLYSKGQLQLEYDAAETRTAAQAFEARAGNCLSLVLMTAAIAKQLDLPVTYQRVYTPSTWSRSNGIAFASEHVNIVLGRRAPESHVAYSQESLMTIDFLPPEETRGQRTRVISEDTVVAMYFNNRAAEALAQGDTNAAYWHARSAIEQAPTHLNAYNTLGVVYLQHGLPQQAAEVLGHVLASEPGNTLALGNQISALESLGRLTEAKRLYAQLQSVEPAPPFHYFDQGIAAYKAGDFEAARDWFRQELRRDAYSHEFHYALALAELALGNTSLARRELGKAAETSTTRERRGIYVAKLEQLKDRERVIR